MGSACCAQKDPNSVGGKAMVPIPCCIRRWIMASIEEAEKLAKGPPNTADIFVVFLKKNWIPGISMGYFNAFLQNMYREDQIFVDKQFTFFSITRDGPGHENVGPWETFSERCIRLYPGYHIDQNMRFRANEKTRTVNLQELVSILKSKDEELWKKSQWIFDNEFKFLDGTPNKTNKIAFASFPRAGNTFMRKCSELLTGVITGADNTLHVNVHLQLQGCRGEDIVDDTVWVIKTHSPWIMPEAPKFQCNKMICVVRNPFDVVLSWLNLLALCNHHQKALFNYHEEYPEWWDWWVKDCVTHMSNWYKIVMHDCRKRDVPVVFIRYEDLCNDPKTEYYDILKYFLNTNDLAGTNAERRINDVLAKGAKATQTYTLKDTSKKYNAQQHCYTEAQIAFTKDKLKDMMYFFGYAKSKSDTRENFTGFYEFDAKTDEEQKNNYMSWKQSNHNVIEWVSQMTDKELETFQYQLSDPKKEVPLADWNTVAKCMLSMQHWTEKKLYGKNSFELK